MTSARARSNAVARAEAILDAADSENRQVSDDEEVAIKACMSEIESCDSIQRAGLREKINHSDAPFSPIGGPAQSSASSIIAGNGVRMQAFNNTRDGREEAFRSGQWLAATLLQDKNAAAWCQANGLAPDVMAAHSGSVNTAGGALVPEELARNIIRLTEEYGLFRQLSRTVPMSSDTLILPRRTGGLEASYVGEGVAGDEDDTSWDSVTLAAKKLMILSRMSSEISEDAVISMADMLAQESALGFALKEDQVAFDGDGTSAYGGHVGINTLALDGTHDKAYVSAASGHDTLPEIDADDLISLMSVLPKYAKRGAVWICSPTAEEVVFNAIKIAGGGNNVDNLTTGTRPVFLGYQVYSSDVVADSLTDTYNNLPMLYFGNLSLASTLGLRRDIRFRVSEHVHWDEDQIGVKATMRHSVQIHDLGSNTVKSPFACLVGTT
jgi:HK97 family phage major capsid protein